MGILDIKNLNLEFQGLKALTDITLDIQPGTVTSIIGPNGAGKSSLLNCISGFYRAKSGSILLNGKDITKILPYEIARLGVARTFQNVELFSGLSVLDNLLLSLYNRQRSPLWSSFFFWGKTSQIEAENHRLVEEVIDFMELHAVRHRPASTLSYGMQKRVELARALTMNPSLILADEPMAGMNLFEKEELVRYILEINRERGTTFILIEHDLNVVMSISSYIHVLNFGKLVASGQPDIIAKDPQVIEAYLGA